MTSTNVPLGILERTDRVCAIASGETAEVRAIKPGSQAVGITASMGAASRRPRRSPALSGPAFHVESTTISPLVLPGCRRTKAWERFPPSECPTNTAAASPTASNNAERSSSASDTAKRTPGSITDCPWPRMSHTIIR